VTDRIDPHDDSDHDHDHDHDHDFTPPPVPPPGPIAQSVTNGFLAIYAATLLLGLVWLASNARQIAPDSQAVVFRFGRIVRTQEAGLLLALPRPFEQVRLLPGPDRQLSQTVQPLPPSGGIEPAQTDPGSDTPGATTPPGAAPYLTGDGNVVLLDATLIYRIADPQTYILAQDHVGPALDRLFRAAAVQVTAGRNLNDFLVARTSSDTADVTELRGAVRDDLLHGVNTRLAALAASGEGLGVEVERIDMTAWLPPEAKVAFDAVLTATQVADQGVAGARTEAERRRQESARERDRLISAAQAAATEKLTNARVATAPILAIDSQETPRTRDSLVLQAYRAELARVMQRVGSVTLLDPQNGARVILPGGQP
jgi:regulator of protease activity HflC (stomatin/prohibitin superfamily)